MTQFPIDHKAAEALRELRRTVSESPLTQRLEEEQRAAEQAAERAAREHIRQTTVWPGGNSFDVWKKRQKEVEDSSILYERYFDTLKRNTFDPRSFSNSPAPKPDIKKWVSDEQEKSKRAISEGTLAFYKFGADEIVTSPIGTFFGAHDNNSPEMQAALQGNPLACIKMEDRPRLRRYLGMLYHTDDEINDALKKEVVIRYFSNCYDIDQNLISEGWDEFTRQLYGKPVSGRDAYEHICAVERRKKQQAEADEQEQQLKALGRVSATGAKQESSYGKRTLGALGAGFFRLSETVYNTLGFSAEFADRVNFLGNAIVRLPFGENLWTDEAARKRYMRNTSYLQGAEFWYGLGDDQRYWVNRLASWGGKPANFLEEIQQAILMEAPTIALTIVTAKLQAGRLAASGISAYSAAGRGTMTWGAGYLGASSFANEYSQTRFDPNINGMEQLLNAATVGTAELAFENTFGMGKLIRKYWLKPFTPQAARKVSTSIMANSLRTAGSIGADALSGGLEEVATGMTQRLSNMLVGKNGKEISQMTLYDIAFELAGDIPLEFSVGFVMDAGVGGVGNWRQRYQQKKYTAEQMTCNADIIGAANEELRVIEAKETLTAEDVQRAEFLRSAVKTENVNALINYAVNDVRQEMSRQFEQASESELTESEWAQQQQRQGIQEAKTLQKGRMPVRETVPQAPVREQTGDQTAVEADPRAPQTIVEPAEQTPATENAGSNPEHIRRIMYQGYVRSVDEAVRELNLEGMSIELIETAAALPEHIRSKPGALRAEGAYDQQTGTVYLVAENLAPSRVGKVLLHEAVGHKGLHQIFGKRYGSFLEQIANDHADGVAAVAARRGLDLMDPAQRIEAADEFLAEMAETRGGEDVSIWKRIVAAVRGFFRRMGFHATWTDDEIADLLRQSRKTLKRNRAAKGEAARGIGLFSVNANGEAEFYIPGRGKMTIADIISDKTLPETTPILTDTGSDIWGQITQEMLEQKGNKFNLEPLPIKLFKGTPAYGIVHIAKHLKDLHVKDISAAINRVFSKPNKIHAWVDGNKIKLEIFSSPPTHWGILELRKENGYYSIVSFYPGDNAHSRAKGELIWEYRAQRFSSQAANDQSRLITPGNMLQDVQEELIAKSGSNINPFNVDFNSGKKTSEKINGAMLKVIVDF